MDVLKFQKIDYKFREIQLLDLGSVLISTTSLNNALMSNGSDYVSDEAKRVDEEIYFFVEEDEIELNEVDLGKLICTQIVW